MPEDLIWFVIDAIELGPWFQAVETVTVKDNKMMMDNLCSAKSLLNQFGLYDWVMNTAKVLKLIEEVCTQN